MGETRKGPAFMEHDLQHTAMSINGWTLHTLHEHLATLIALQREEFLALFATKNEAFTALMQEAEKRNSQRFDAQQEGVSTAMTANEKAVNAAMAAAEKLGNVQQLALDKAIQKAEAAQYDKNVSMNEIRKMAEDAQNKFASISMVNLQIDGLQAQLRTLQLQIQQFAGRSDGHTNMLGWGLGILGVAVAVAAMFFKH